MNRLVVKVGGSLYDWPGLRTSLRDWLAERRPSLLVPGGGRYVEAIRERRLDDETAHWQALEAMNVAADYLAELCGDPDLPILDAFAYCRLDDECDDALPHSWDVSSDSVAARVAEQSGAELVLLKSADAPPGSIAAWAAAGYVDRYFPIIVARANLSVRAVNLRAC